MEFYVLTPDQVVGIIEKNEETIFEVRPRLIDNPDCESYGDPLAALGNSILTTEVLNTPEYADFWGEVISGLPVRDLDPDLIFIPAE